VSHFFPPNQIAVFFWKIEFLLHEDSQYTGVWQYWGVYKILRWASKNRLYTKMLRIHLFSIFTIKTQQALNHEYTAKCTLLIVLNYEITVTNILIYILVQVRNQEGCALHTI